MKQQFRDRLHDIIFEADTPLGRAFDIGLILSIIASVIVVMLDSVASIHQAHGLLLGRLEWFFTLLFTVEYVLRLGCIRKPLNYAGSFFGVVDLLAILPTYISLFLPGTQYLSVIRVLRVLRIFRVLKLVQFVHEYTVLLHSIRASIRKIFVFLFGVFALAVIFGSIMYTIEPASSGFTSIPKSIYWAIVTLTTVGYGDITPVTSIGQVLAAAIMIMGYGIIAVPAGIVSVDIATTNLDQFTTQSCHHCSRDGHDKNAIHCKFCGERLNA